MAQPMYNTMANLSEDLIFSPEYSEGLRDSLEIAYHTIRSKQPTPTFQKDIYTIPASKVFGAIGKIGLELSAERERCPITDALVPKNISVEVHDSFEQSAALYEYNSRQSSDTWLRRLAFQGIHRSRHLTPRDTAIMISRSLADPTELSGVALNPDPSTPMLVDELMEFAETNNNFHKQKIAYRIPLPTKTSLEDGRNDATVTLTAESINNDLHKLSVDVASLYILDNLNILRVASVDDYARPRIKDYPLMGSLAVRGASHRIDSVRPLVSQEASMNDPWPLFHELNSGLEAIRRSY